MNTTMYIFFLLWRIKVFFQSCFKSFDFFLIKNSWSIFLRFSSRHFVLAYSNDWAPLPHLAISCFSSYFSSYSQLLFDQLKLSVLFSFILPFSLRILEENINVLSKHTRTHIHNDGKWWIYSSSWLCQCTSHIVYVYRNIVL